MSLVADLKAGSRRALARLITQVENNTESGQAALAELFPLSGQAHLIGVTGAPGTGKSSLVNQLALDWRKQGKTVAIIAVDPTSPFTGGALLGDRIRMRDLSGDKGVFIRSMASRGSLGGLARTTADVVTVLDAAGFDVILIETVGAGQSEIDIARYALSVIVVEAPGLGDDVQAIKAGILEIADILVVNKSDDPRARSSVRALQAMLDLTGGMAPDHETLRHHGRVIAAIESKPEVEGWRIPIQETNALEGSGVADLVQQLEAHHSYLQESGELARRERVRFAATLDNLLRSTLLDRLLQAIPPTQITAVLDQMVQRQLDPHQAAHHLIGHHLKQEG
ncbi:MAG: methylmalonyl Co-A mutase-associated GTPase MeaB [Chloroflexi bacterium]|nr:methylmalonyl Co-A mutase-associated GTPase MeaB [Chloroflexota bacterium]